MALAQTMVATAGDYGYQRLISDRRLKPADGVLNSYADIPGTPYKLESSYRMIEGQLASEQISRMPDGDRVRRTMADGVSPFFSNTIPESLSKFPDGRISRVQLNPKTITDSYEFVVITVAQDGSGSTSYMRSFGGTPVQRKLGPEEIYWDKNGAITELVYMDGTNRRSVKGDVSVVAYNGASGDNWDGSYLKPSDFAAQANF